MMEHIILPSFTERRFSSSLCPSLSFTLQVNAPSYTAHTNAIPPFSLCRLLLQLCLPASQPLIVVHEPNEGARLGDKNDISNLPYMHRNPAV